MTTVDEMNSALQQLGVSASRCVELVAGISDAPESHKEVAGLKDALRAAGVACDSDTLERALLAHAMERSAGKIDALPVPPSVQELIRRQFRGFSQPAGTAGPSLAVDAEENDPFIAACKICTLRRFPAGPLDWVVSGLPRKWLLKMPPLALPRAVRFILYEFGGIKPAFYVHIAHSPRNRALVIEKEVRKAYYRMARALALQPEIKGIMCATWLHDPAAIERYPYLAALNEPYLKLGGRLVTDLGPAPVSSGFLKYNAERRELYNRGELKLKTVLAMWPRKSALEWADQMHELES